ncbi:MAG: family 43 glycosylhydrolase [Phycisphaerae bacterium]
MFKKLAFAILLSVVAADCFALSEKDMSAYLFAYFTGNGAGEEQIRFALSEDGFNYKALNSNNPVIRSEDISTSGGVRDPHILRGEDGKTFYMVATDLYVPDMGWSNFAMVMLKSTDLIHWTSSIVHIPDTYPEQFGDVYRVWAPQTIYDRKAGKYMLYFSMKQGNAPDKIYYAYANEDFTALEAAPKQLYFPPSGSNNRACIDGDIIEKGGRYYLFHKAEDGKPGIKLAISNELTSGYELYSNERMDCSGSPVEGSGIFKLNGTEDWILMYDMYTSGRYQFTKSSDLLNFEVIDSDISMDFHPRHGTVMPVTADEYARLMSKWGTISNLDVKSNSDKLRRLNVEFDATAQTMRLPVVRGTDISAFDPELSAVGGVEITPKGARDFTEGPVSYTLRSGSRSVELIVTVAVDGNPVLSGYYADPDIIYAEKTGRYYIYPTSDGFDGWSGTFFKAFSSADLSDWKDEGVILDLKKDVSWADRNAWAPCIIEKKQADGSYKYYYYFTAAQKIGVATSDDPAGPFTDSGKPIVDFRPEGARGGQEIDPDVFYDPETGKNYLYWGNGHMAVAELSDDMLTIKRDTIKLLRPGRTFREGTHVLYRKGKYYFLWSEDDTRSENYRVRYGISDSPLGPLTIPQDNLVIAKDVDRKIYATGHNSTIQVPGKDEWYIVYHRFTRPEGIRMSGGAGGFHRETCIDKLEFDEDGFIKRSHPTLHGIESVANPR